MGAIPSSGPLPVLQDLVDSAAAHLRARGGGDLFCAGGPVLAVADATPQGEQAAWRGALIARDCGLPLHLIQADDDAGRGSSAHRLARQVRQRLGVPAVAVAAQGGLDERLMQLSQDAELLVLPHRPGNAVIDCLLGTTPERIFRSAGVPTLIVKRPATTSYRRVLVPVELDDDATQLIDAARRISRAPRIRVLHVLDRGQEHLLRLADAPEHALRAQRQRRTRAAYALLNRAITRAGASERAAAVVSFGDAGSRVPEVARASRAQLVVLGKRRLSLFEQLFTTSVTTRLIGAGGPDVLLLPVQGRASHAGALPGEMLHPYT